ncbi:hypothetical protein GCM10028832_22200 [Streptomyces sparsus]
MNGPCSSGPFGSGVSISYGLVAPSSGQWVCEVPEGWAYSRSETTLGGLCDTNPVGHDWNTRYRLA